MLDVLNKFISNVKIEDENNCWEWIGSKNKQGYGIFCCGVSDGAHRISYELFTHVRPVHEHVLHLCDNPICVNPHHLMLGDAAENSRQAVERNRTAKQWKTHCKRGHELNDKTVVLTKRGRACRACRDMHNSLNNPLTNSIIKKHGKYINLKQT